MARKNVKKSTSGMTTSKANAIARKSMSALVLRVLLAVFKIVALRYQHELEIAKRDKGESFNESEFWADTATCERVLKSAHHEPTGETTKSGDEKTKSQWLKRQLVNMIAPLFRCGVRTHALMQAAIKRFGIHASIVTVANEANAFAPVFALVRNMSRSGLITNDKKAREVYFRVIVNYFASETGVTGAKLAVLRAACPTLAKDNKAALVQVISIEAAIKSWLEASHAATVAKTPQPNALTWIGIFNPKASAKAA